MTSSLVGSEMCIRDRRQPPRRSSAKEMDNFLDYTEGGSRLRKICLLYTSDAADEQCVDLGGR
eukprot:6864887-Prorocentrum_lima.AAC.1